MSTNFRVQRAISLLDMKCPWGCRDTSLHVGDALIEHVSVCTMVEVQCTLCPQLVRRGATPSHICEEQAVECELCGDWYIRREQHVHCVGPVNLCMKREFCKFGCSVMNEGVKAIICQECGNTECTTQTQTQTQTQTHGEGRTHKLFHLMRRDE